MKPLYDNIIIAELKEENENTTESGIILTDSLDDKTKMGLVMAVGPDVKQVELHQKVIPNWSKGHVIKVGDLQGVVLKEEDVLCVM